MGVKQQIKSISVRGGKMADSFFQLMVISGREMVESRIKPFSDQLQELNEFPLKPHSIEVFQLNIGKLCNQTCLHCHVDAGPDKTKENMSRKDLETCLTIIRDVPGITTVDITGGAPEMHPDFRWFVRECRKLGKKVINRCNLTIIMANKKYRDLPEFFRDNQVHLVSSLPYYSKNRTDKQRGDGVFEDSIAALKLLNEVGYGQEGSGLVLDLVYNPAGAFLPAGQEVLEPQFKAQLKRKFDIVFNSLFAITNLPINRFLEYLIESGNYKDYMQTLLEAYNPSTIDGIMCRSMISVSWDGYIYDCDFNQMLELKVDCPSNNHIDDFDAKQLLNRDIIVNQHCYGCTAGAGSSCGGEVV